MGNLLFKKVDRRIVVEGIDGAGKTSLLYRLKLGEAVTTTPTPGVNEDTIKVGALIISCCEIGGIGRTKPFHRHHYYPKTDGFIYVIDSTDRDRLGHAVNELVHFIFLEEKAAGTVVMILANKQDRPGAMTALEIKRALEDKYDFSSTSASAHTVIIRPCSVATGEGVHEAFEEFSEQLRLKCAGQAEPGLLPLVTEVINGRVDETETKDRVKEHEIKDTVKEGSYSDALSRSTNDEKQNESFAVAG